MLDTACLHGGDGLPSERSAVFGTPLVLEVGRQVAVHVKTSFIRGLER